MTADRLKDIIQAQLDQTHEQLEKSHNAEVPIPDKDFYKILGSRDALASVLIQAQIEHLQEPGRELEPVTEADQQNPFEPLTEAAKQRILNQH